MTHTSENQKARKTLCFPSYKNEARLSLSKKCSSVITEFEFSQLSVPLGWFFLKPKLFNENLGDARIFIRNIK